MPAMLARLLLFLCFASCTVGNSKGSAYDLLSGTANKTAVFAGGCFWCMEEAFERYVPGVMEAVSGFSGGEMTNPTYKNHNGHFEVVKVIYNPALTSYQVLVDYYWRNIDPFDDQGQFCDKGGAYKPAIFYSDDAERLIAEQSKAAIQGKLGAVKVVVPILPTKPFWTAEDYHQDYYLTTSEWYYYYKDRCGRVARLQAVWGKEVYECFHDKKISCEGMAQVRNSFNATVDAGVNLKQGTDPGNTGLPPAILAAIIIPSVLGGICLCGACCWLVFHRKVLSPMAS